MKLRLRNVETDEIIELSPDERGIITIPVGVFAPPDVPDGLPLIEWLKRLFHPTPRVLHEAEDFLGGETVTGSRHRDSPPKP